MNKEHKCLWREPFRLFKTCNLYPLVPSCFSRVKKDFGPYLEALDKITDTQLQYVIAKTGVQLGLEQPITVLKARQSMIKTEKKSKNLDKKILKRLRNGVYAKRVDKFLASEEP